MQFKDVIGQSPLKSRILSLTREGHLPHAILLTGKEGSGALALALATARYIHCSQRGEFDSCGECSSCIKMQKLQHPDLHFSFPVTRRDDQKDPPVSDQFIASFREFILQNPYANDTDWFRYLDTNRQGNITARECREVIRKLQLKSFESRYKVLIMWYPEYLDTEGNILLKQIEEPTPNTIMFFVCYDENALLPTIQSRTQLFPLQKLSDPEIKDALEERQCNAVQAARIARMAEGDFRYALQLLSEGEDRMLEWFRNWLNALYMKKSVDLSEWCVALADESKEFQKKYLEYVIQFLEHLIRYRHLNPEQISLPEQEQKLAEGLITRGVSDQRISRLVPELNEAIYKIERNANSKMLFHALSLRVQDLLLSGV